MEEELEEAHAATSRERTASVNAKLSEAAALRAAEKNSVRAADALKEARAAHAEAKAARAEADAAIEARFCPPIRRAVRRAGRLLQGEHVYAGRQGSLQSGCMRCGRGMPLQPALVDMLHRHL